MYLEYVAIRRVVHSCRILMARRTTAMMIRLSIMAVEEGIEGGGEVVVGKQREREEGAGVSMSSRSKQVLQVSPSLFNLSPLLSILFFLTQSILEEFALPNTVHSSVSVQS